MTSPPLAHQKSHRLTILFVAIVTSTCWGQLGDFNGDGIWSCDDIDGLTAEIVSGTNDPAFDLTGDGLVDASDGHNWLVLGGAANLQSGQPYLPGDSNLDGTVDVSDFMIWNGSKFTRTAAWCSGDVSFDGVVDVRDFNWWNDNKFQSSGLLLAPDDGPLPLDDAVEFLYDASSGLMTIDTNDFEIWCFSVFGVEPEEFLLNGGGIVDPDETIWVQDFFVGHSKWFSLDTTSVADGAIARFAPGLTASDFDYVSFGSLDGLMGRGSVTIVNGPVAVPEPATLVWQMTFALCCVARFRYPSGKGLER